MGSRSWTWTTSIVAIIVRALTNVTELFLNITVAGHDSAIGVLVILVGWIKALNGLLDVGKNAIITLVTIVALSVISVPVGREGLGMLILSEEHVLGVVVHQVALLLTKFELSDKTSDTQFLNDLQNVKLLIQSRASLSLQLVLIRVLVSAAQTPWAAEVLFGEESPH